MKKFTLFLSAMLFSVMSFAAVITFTPGDFDPIESSQFDAVKDGVTLSCSSGTITADQFRFFKSQTLTVSSTAGNITSIEFTCTAANDTKHGPGGFGSLEGYTYADKVGIWTGNAASVTFSTTNNQVRATQVVVTIDGEGGGENPGGDNPGGELTEEVTISDLAYAMAFYVEEEGAAYWEIELFNLDATGENLEFPLVALGVEAKSKTALNGTYDMIMAVYGTGEDAEGYVEGVYMSEDAAGTLTIKNVDNEGTYSFVGTFVGEDDKTYKLNTESFMVWVEDEATGEEITLNENPGDNPGDDPVTPPAGGGVTFDADVDKGNASEDSSNQTPYTVSKGGVTLDVTKGIIGKYNEECHYRVYQNETLTLTSTVGNIVSVEFTCTANDNAKYGPGNFTVDSGNYTYAGAMGTWTGNAASVVFTAATAQVRASQIVVKVATGTGLEDVTTIEIPVKVMQNGQVLIIRGENTYNVLGAQVK